MVVKVRDIFLLDPILVGPHIRSIGEAISIGTKRVAFLLDVGIVVDLSTSVTLQCSMERIPWAPFDIFI